MLEKSLKKVVRLLTKGKTIKPTKTIQEQMSLEIQKDKEDFSNYSWKQLEYLYADLEEDLFSCNDEKREYEIGHILDEIEEEFYKRSIH